MTIATSATSALLLRKSARAVGSPRNRAVEKEEIKEITMQRRGSLQAIHAKSPNYMIATDPNHYMPEDNTHFAEAIQLTIDAGLEKK